MLQIPDLAICLQALIMEFLYHFQVIAIIRSNYLQMYQPAICRIGKEKITVGLLGQPYKLK